VAAFRATLEEIAEADLLLHVVDVTHPNALTQAQVVHETLVEIEAGHIPVITALNKIDRLSDPAKAVQALTEFENAVAISALTGVGLDNLLTVVDERLYETYIPISVFLPYQAGGLAALFHEQGQIELLEHVQGGTIIQGRIPGRLVARYRPFEKKAQVHSYD
jgi:GTP-binding protein HflX